MRCGNRNVGEFGTRIGVTGSLVRGSRCREVRYVAGTDGNSST